MKLIPCPKTNGNDETNAKRRDQEPRLDRPVYRRPTSSQNSSWTPLLSALQPNRLPPLQINVVQTTYIYINCYHAPPLAYTHIHTLYISSYKSTHKTKKMFIGKVVDTRSTVHTRSVKYFSIRGRHATKFRTIDRKALDLKRSGKHHRGHYYHHPSALIKLFFPD